MRVPYTITILIVLLAPYNSNCERKEPQPIKKPNIIYVLADQWRASATGYNGDLNLIGKTPNIDRMAKEGIHFKNAISVTPVCTPYRAALMTGQYPTTTGMIFNDLHLPEKAVTMAELFKVAGYNTAYIGKWHLDGMGRTKYTPPERRQGFDYWKALECSHDYNNLLYYTGNNDEQKHWEGYGPNAETKDAITYIQQNAASSEPFLLVLAWGAPHFPHTSAPKQFQQQFKQDDIILHGNVPAELEEAAQRESVGYYGHILSLDKCIGELQTAIEAAGIAENTIVVFTSDHGEMMGSHGVAPRQKQVPWSESVKVPFLLNYPAKYGKKQIEVDIPINTPDILPTLLSLAGLPVPAFIEGEDMVAAISNPKSKKGRAVLVMNVSPFAGKAEEYRGIYTSRYAYVKTLAGPWLLFDNLKDPFQLNNLVGKPAYRKLHQQMEDALQLQLRKVGDAFKPRQHYIEKWGYRLARGGEIDYSENAEVQGPGINKK